MLRSRGRSAARVLLALGLLVPTVALSGSAHASFPGTNGKIFITSNLGTPGTDIYSINPDGTGLKRLTTGAANDSFAAVSPSGKRVAFVSERDGNPEIYVMNADGSGQARLTN